MRSLLVYLFVCLVQLFAPALCLAGMAEHACASSARHTHDSHTNGSHADDSHTGDSGAGDSHNKDGHCDHEQGCSTDPCQISIGRSVFQTPALSARLVNEPIFSAGGFKSSLFQSPLEAWQTQRRHLCSQQLHLPSSSPYPSSSFPLLI